MDIEGKRKEYVRSGEEQESGIGNWGKGKGSEKGRRRKKVRQ